ncbi:MAG: hypothetical protein HC863_00960 [Myxococcales bacterium]|nr:hypothetical protein [Myxococcales bacterium]
MEGALVAVAQLGVAIELAELRAVGLLLLVGGLERLLELRGGFGGVADLVGGRVAVAGELRQVGLGLLAGLARRLERLGGAIHGLLRLAVGLGAVFGGLLAVLGR